MNPPLTEKDLEIDNHVDETSVKSILSTPPPNKQSKMFRSDSDKENLLVTPESNRPSRHRKTVERMGIDDVKLLDTISPKVKFSTTSSSKLDDDMDEEVTKGLGSDKSNKHDEEDLELKSELPSLHDILSTPKSVSDLFDEMIGSGTTEIGSTTSAGNTTGSNVKENDDVNAIDELLTTPPVSKTYSKRRKSENQNNQQSDSVTRNLVVINLTPSRKKLSKEAVKESEIDHGE